MRKQAGKTVVSCGASFCAEVVEEPPLKLLFYYFFIADKTISSLIFVCCLFIQRPFAVIRRKQINRFAEIFCEQNFKLAIAVSETISHPGYGNVLQGSDVGYVCGDARSDLQLPL